ncbi:hypothetical protein RDWZM_003839 [Blomia tropicalis]|uniref:Angiotensin-converting enzyme n=1 Tax=Blomia tropicalis TaxID=40697 RepID=A0A9Q0RSX8_BLOTA|nr:hypothetical protein RDWZM_003839 [Blomia tropicalis]
MNKLNDVLEKLNTAQVNASWIFNTNITNYNEEQLLKETSKYNKEQKAIWQEIQKFSNYKQYQDPALRRQLEKLSVLGIAALDSNESQKFINISTEMERIYSSASVCLPRNGSLKCGLELEPDLSNIMATSRDYNLLRETWLRWRDSAGRPIRNLYLEYIRLGNKAAIKNGFKTLDDLWLFPWETPDFKQQIEQLWQEVMPYYQKFHAYVRMKLRKFYGAERMPNDGTIPAHILGNMWAQSWTNIFDVVAPYPGKKSLDVSETMRAQNYTALRMVQLSDKFFTDLGLIPMPGPFWRESMINKPTDRKVVCHASAWDFYNRKDFRIKMCTNVNMEDLITVHHEMGHIQYYLQYKNQPVTFREGANPGFHEAIGDLLALSVSTPKHLSKINLLSDYEEDHELTLNHQMQMALQKVSFLPFGYLMDAWRWDLFSGKASKNEMNRHWWMYRLKLQGVSPPVKRNETDFDAGAKFHVPASVEYIRYFVSFIIQFQFHKSLCDIAQPNVPLHQCDIDGNQEAGQRLAKALALGSSQEWPKTMEMMTGSRNMSAKPLIEYFNPLWKYIDEQIKNENVGWNFNVNQYMENNL